MSSPATPQRGGGRPSTSKGTRKRSASSPFVSLFGTLFSSSNSHSDAASSPQPAQPNAAPSRYQNDSAAAPADATRSRGHRRSQRRSENRSQAVMAPSHSTQPSRAAIAAAPAAAAVAATTSAPTSTSKALTRRQSTPQKQMVRHSRPPSTVSTANGGTKPNVFAYMSGEISTPPTPRPRAGAPKGLGITDGKPIERSANIKHVSAPIPKRPPPRIPQSASSMSSEQSDSDDTISTVDSPPETPTPQQARALAAAQAATKSLERVTGQGQGQDAVGRSLRTPEYFKQVGRTQPTTPPEAPMPPHMMQQYQQPHVASVYDYQQSPQGFSYPSTPGHFGQSNSFSRPYPTPPLDQPSSGLTTSRSGGTLSDLQQSELSLLREAVDGTTSSKMPELLPRQYRALTLTTIKRTEVMIDSLEAELRSLDKSAPIMQREHLTMRLTNTLVMHHRLVDTWSKVSQLSPLKMTKLEDRQKIEAVWVQLRQQYGHLKHINGVGTDKFINNVVNDLVHVGERAESDQKEDGGSASARTQDLRIIMVLLGVVLTFLLLKDEAFQKVAIVAGVVLGIYVFSQANVQSHVLGTMVDSTKSRGSAQ